MDTLEAWEHEAEAFYKASGYLRPGKDPGILGDEGYRERRDKAWKLWCAAWDYKDKYPSSTYITLKDTVVWLLALVKDSKGVTGYHLNGDLAPWSEFDEALNAAGDALSRYMRGTR